MTLAGVLIAVAGFLGIGYLADRTQRDEKLLGRVLAICAIMVVAGLGYSIVKGDLLRFATYDDSD